jgi:hypothetical protein
MSNRGIAAFRAYAKLAGINGTIALGGSLGKARNIKRASGGGGSAPRPTSSFLR